MRGVGFKGTGIGEGASMSSGQRVQVTLAVDGDARRVMDVVGRWSPAHEDRRSQQAFLSIVGDDIGRNTRHILVRSSRFSPDDMNSVTS